MPIFAFAATVGGLDVNDIDQVDRLYSDAFTIQPGEIDGVTTLDVYIPAPTGLDALRQFTGHLSAAAPEVRIVRLDEDLVTVSEVADRVGKDRESVRLWATGQRRAAFPAYRNLLPKGVKLWAWASVFAWLESYGEVDVDALRPLDVELVDYYNGLRAAELQPQVAYRSIA